MGQFGNQPDFITNDIQEISRANGFISDTPSRANFLNSSIIYVGNADPGDTLAVIPAGTVGPSVISGFSSPGYAGSRGTNYENGPRFNIDTKGGSGTGLTVNYTGVDGAVQTVEVSANSADVGYLNGDLIEIDPQGADPGFGAVFRIIAAPGLPTLAQAVRFGVADDQILPVTVDYVMSTGTSANTLVAGK